MVGLSEVEQASHLSSGDIIIKIFYIYSMTRL